MIKNGCLWLTGFSGSGKTTLAKKLCEVIPEAEHLDGDIVRKSFNRDLGFSKEDRDENIRRVSYVASYLSQNKLVICTFISPYRQARDKAKTLCENFVEVFVDCPIQVCETRDVKGLYAKVRKGEIQNFTGITDPYEEPLNPDIHLRTDLHTIDECVTQIIDYLNGTTS